MKTVARVNVSPKAGKSVIAQADYYAEEADDHLAERWLRAVDKALVVLLDAPEIGAPCDFNRLAHLRRLTIPGFPNHLLVYRFTPGNGARDIQTLLQS